MFKYTKLTISLFNIQLFKFFIKKFYFILRKYGITLMEPLEKQAVKRFTLLRSPHVNKTARDQIELFSKFFEIRFKPKTLFQFHLYFLNKLNKYSFKFKYQKMIKQQFLLKNV